MKTLAAVLVAHNEPLRLMEIKIPALEVGQVLVKILFSGICHSQLMEISGQRGVDKYLPHMLGHEGAGTVEDVGPGVNKVKKGDKIVISWIKSGGIDAPGAKYRFGKKIINAGPVTTFNTFAIVSENRCIPLPSDIPMDVATLFGCAIPTGAGIVLNSIKPAKNSSIVVFGMGGVGLSALLGARICACNKIIVVDVVSTKLELAKKLGATHAINAQKENVVYAINSLTSGKGADYAVEATGKTEIIEQAFQSVRKGGGVCVFASHPPHGEKIKIDPFDLICGKQLRGSWGGESNPDRDVPRWSDLYLRGKMPLDELITHRFLLEKINDALTLLKSGSAGRIIIEIK